MNLLLDELIMKSVCFIKSDIETYLFKYVRILTTWVAGSISTTLYQDACQDQLFGVLCIWSQLDHSMVTWRPFCFDCT